MTEQALYIERTATPATNVMDVRGPPPNVLQRLVDIAAQAVGAPIAWLVFSDAYRRWGTLRYGNSAEDAAIVLPDHAALSEECVIIPDPRMLSDLDYRRTLPAPAGTRFYAYAPVYIGGTKLAGALHLMDRQPREVTQQQATLIADYATLISEALDNYHMASRLQAAEAAQRASETFNQAIIDSLTAHIAVLDRASTIIAVNAAWKRFANENSAEGNQFISIGINYLQVCRRADDAIEALHTLQGLEAVLSGACDTFSMEYPCHSATEERWFLMTITPLRHEWGGAVTTHVDITARKRAEHALQQTKDALEQHVELLTRAWQQAQHERELESLDLLSSYVQTPTSAAPLSHTTLRETHPALFETLSTYYAHILELALDQRAYKIDHRLQERLRRVGEQLSVLGAGPRDVVEIHTITLRRKVAKAAPERAQAYLEESRWLVLELMGNVAALYRLSAQRQNRRISHGTPEDTQA